MEAGPASTWQSTFSSSRSSYSSHLGAWYVLDTAKQRLSVDAPSNVVVEATEAAAGLSPLMGQPTYTMATAARFESNHDGMRHEA